MSNCKIASGFGFLFLAAAASAARAESIEEVQKQIHEKVSKYKTLAYTAEIQAHMTVSGMTIKTETEQKAEYKRDGDHALSHIETKTKSSQSMPGQSTTIESTSLEVCDGKFKYILSEGMGQKMASRQALTSAIEFSPFDPMRGFKEVAQTFDFKLLPDEKIDGRATWVIQMTAKPGTNQEALGKAVSYYDKSTGLSLKSVAFDSGGKQVSVQKMSNIKIDEPIAAGRFQFTPPPGVKVTDLSAMGQP